MPGFQTGRAAALVTTRDCGEERGGGWEEEEGGGEDKRGEAKRDPLGIVPLAPAPCLGAGARGTPARCVRSWPVCDAGLE